MTFSALAEFGVRCWVREASRETAHEKQEIPRCFRRIQVASGTGPNSLFKPSLWKILRIPGLGAGAGAGARRGSVLKESSKPTSATWSV